MKLFTSYSFGNIMCTSTRIVWAPTDTLFHRNSSATNFFPIENEEKMKGKQRHTHTHTPVVCSPNWARIRQFSIHLQSRQCAQTIGKCSPYEHKNTTFICNNVKTFLVICLVATELQQRTYSEEKLKVAEMVDSSGFACENEISNEMLFRNGILLCCRWQMHFSCSRQFVRFGSVFDLCAEKWYTNENAWLVVSDKSVICLEHISSKWKYLFKLKQVRDSRYSLKTCNWCGNSKSLIKMNDKPPASLNNTFVELVIDLPECHSSPPLSILCSHSFQICAKTKYNPNTSKISKQICFSHKMSVETWHKPGSTLMSILQFDHQLISSLFSDVPLID